MPTSFIESVSKNKDAKSEDKKLAMEGKDTMTESASSANNAIISPKSDNDNVIITKEDTDAVASFGKDLKSAQQNAAKVNQIIAQGGYTGDQKDTIDLTVAYNNWKNSKRAYTECPDKIKQASVNYLTISGTGSPQNQQIQTNQKRENVKEQCDDAPDKLVEKAKLYLEVDKRVQMNRSNVQAIDVVDGFTTISANKRDILTNNITPLDDNNIDIGKEGFTWYKGEYIINSAAVSHPRMPTLNENGRGKTGGRTGILPWGDFYTDCSGMYQQADSTDRNTCNASNEKKGKYISAFNNLFFEADTLLNIYDQITSGSANAGVNTERTKLLQQVLDRQSSDINIFKQQSQYSYDEYNTLAYVEDTFLFVYYALLILFVVLSLRDMITSWATYDKKNLIILLLFVLFPKYILRIVLWIFGVLNTFFRMIGIKNVLFWW